jgi:small GTP-binding protein
MSGMPPIKVFVFGLDRAGKTVIVNYLVKKVPETNLNPTLNMNYHSLDIEEQDFRIWDAPGQEKLRFTWDSGLHNANILVFVVDSSDRNRFAEAKAVFESFLGEVRNVQRPLVIVFSKIDLLEGCGNIEELKHLFQISGETKLQQFFLETTIRRPETIDLLRYLLNLFTKPDFLSRISNLDISKLQGGDSQQCRG